jgi:predicted nucleotidyltransferase
MSSAKDKAINKAKKLIRLLKTNGIDVHEGYLFGSSVTDRAGEYSDIDIAVVSKDFTGMPFYDVKKIRFGNRQHF